MAAARRSTRLSSVCKPTLLASPKTLKRDSIWQLRKSRNSIAIHSDEEEEELSSNCSNQENCDSINKTKQVTSSTVNNILKTSEVGEMKTPKSKKIIRPMPASKKMETLKRQQIEVELEANSSDDDSQQSSPPKQSKQQANTPQKHNISPSRLLDRLSIDERVEHIEKPENDKTPKKLKEHSSQTTPLRNKYQSARKVLNSAECQNLPGREQQLEELRTFFREHLESKRSGSLYVSGQPGTGKTACLSLLLRTPEFNRRLQTVYVNCTSIASIGGVYKKLCTELNLKPQGRTERDHLLALQHYFKTCSKMLLIVLDEIDQLCNSKQSVLYTIFEWPSMPDAKILLVGIANSLDLTERALLRLNARCELKPKHMHFPPYSKQQIVDIFKSRLEEAEVLDIFPPVTLQLLAAKVSAVSGDVRRALDIGRRVVEIAEQQKKAGERKVNLKNLNFVGGEEAHSTKEILEPVQVTQVASVLNKVYGVSQNLQEDMDESFPLQQKIMLCSLMLMLRKEKNKDITMSRLHEVYRRVCTKRNIHPVDQGEFTSLVDLVQTRGILRIIKKKEPRLSKVQLQWDEDEVNGALRDKQLIASILDDTSCLGK